LGAPHQSNHFGPFGSDLTALYGVETRVLNHAVKRNLERFPAGFMFHLSAKEFENRRSQLVMSKPGARMGPRRAPFALTEHGAHWRPPF
jgi:hypothetical protein